MPTNQSVRSNFDAIELDRPIDRPDNFRRSLLENHLFTSIANL